MSDAKRPTIRKAVKSRKIPILALRNAVLFPGTVMPLVVGRKKTMDLLEDIKGTEQLIGVLTQKDRMVDDPQGDDLYAIGTLARTLKVVQEGGQGSHIIVQGVSRFRVRRFTESEPYLVATIQDLPDPEEDDLEVEALSRNMRQAAGELIALLPEVPAGAADLLERTGSATHLAYLFISNIPVPIEEKIEIIEANDAKSILRKSLKSLHHQLEVLRVSQKINSEVKGDLTKTQREYVLRKQLNAIKKELTELGVDDDDALSDLRQKLDDVGLSEEAREAADSELQRLTNIQPSSPEYTVTRTYLDWLASVPWATESDDNLDIVNAREVLEERHYGLEKVKKRILEYLAVRRLKENRSGPIICLVGPPGTGKTSLGQSIAEAMGRKYVRIALGGVRDEAEIRGHRRTYIGALPGKIIQSLKRAGTKNPVFILDEIDKLGRDWRGDPTSAMLEVLDPEQNTTFVDHYLDLKFDLSKVLFIATANMTDTIPAALIDRMEIIELSGYTRDEKLNIARKHLLPKELEDHGLSEKQVELTDERLGEIIDHYTREAGVRNLNRRLADVCRAIAVGIVEREEENVPANFSVDEEMMREYLGPERFDPCSMDRTFIPGVATGMAWTAFGGDILFIEASRMPGQGKLRLTGQLGDVMKESCEIALSCVRTWAASYGISEDVFEGHDIHIHVPAGATPKDGPSAGITMFAALVSLLSGVPVRRDVAMTGEITLRGLVLPVGGVKDKVLAAQRGGIKTVILPSKNEKDLPDIPENIREELDIVFVEGMDDVLVHVLETAEGLPFHSDRESAPGSPFHFPAEA